VFRVWDRGIASLELSSNSVIDGTRGGMVAGVQRESGIGSRGVPLCFGGHTLRDDWFHPAVVCFHQGQGRQPGSS
jgi:hypothetical protein